MEKHEEKSETVIDLGAVSVETRGIGLGFRDGAVEYAKIMGLSED